jgi:hypothetical protein
VSDEVTLNDITDEPGRFVIRGSWVRIDPSSMPKLPPSEPSWECFQDKQQDYLLYAGPKGLRCWQLLPDGTQHEVTRTVVPEQYQHPAAPQVCKNCKKVIQDHQALFMDKQGRVYHQPGSTICK